MMQLIRIQKAPEPGLHAIHKPIDPTPEDLTAAILAHKGDVNASREAINKLGWDFPDMDNNDGQLQAETECMRIWGGSCSVQNLGQGGLITHQNAIAPTQK